MLPASRDYPSRPAEITTEKKRKLETVVSSDKLRRDR
jgi:hypothetical protein